MTKQLSEGRGTPFTSGDPSNHSVEAQDTTASFFRRKQTKRQARNVSRHVEGKLNGCLFFCCKQAIKELENTACDVWNISETSNESLQSKQTWLAMDGRFVWPWAIAGKLNWIHIDIAICISFQTQFPLIFPPIIWKLARHSYMAWGLMYILHLWFGVSERCWTMNLIWTNDT